MRLATWIKLAGIVVIAVIVVQVGKVIADRTTSGCDRAGGDIAHAETSDCRGYVRQAAGDPSFAGDVETKVAMVMREGGATSGVVAINHPRMCTGPVSCRVAITAILPKGSVLYVWELGATRSIECDGEGACH